MKQAFLKVCRLISLCALIALTEQALAQQNPVQMLQGITSKVMQSLKTNRDSLKQQPQKIYGMVNQYIIPYVDFTEMARWVVGKNAWQSAKPEAQQAFVSEFKTLVIKTYAQSLLSYTNQTIEFLPIRGSLDKDRIQVSSVIKQPGKNSIRMDYRLLKQGDSWKVYDIIIEGVSLMQGYRAQFAEDVQRGGLSAVTAKMQGKNAQPSSYGNGQSNGGQNNRNGNGQNENGYSDDR